MVEGEEGGEEGTDQPQRGIGHRQGSALQLARCLGGIRHGRPLHDHRRHALDGATLQDVLHHLAVGSVGIRDLLETGDEELLVQGARLTLHGQECLLHTLQRLRRRAPQGGCHILVSVEGPHQHGGIEGGIRHGQVAPEPRGEPHLLPLELGHPGNQVAVLRAQSRASLQGRLKLPLLIPSACQHDGIVQTLHPSAVRLGRVQEGEDLVSCIHLFGALRIRFGEDLVGLGPALEETQDGGLLNVPAELQLRHGLEPCSGPGIPDDEDQIALLDTVPIKGEVILGAERLVVLVVDTVEGDVQIVAGVGEVVVVTTEVGHLLLRSHHQLRVGVLPENVGGVESAVVHVDDLDQVAPILTAELLCEARFDLLDRFLARLSPLLIVLHSLQGGVDLFGDVSDLHEHIGEELLAHLALLLQGGGVESVGEEILPLLARRGDVLPGAVVVRHDEAVGRDEGRRTARDPNRAQTSPIEPLHTGLEAVGHPQVVRRGVIEGPHLPVVECPCLDRVQKVGQNGSGLPVGPYGFQHGGGRRIPQRLRGRRVHRRSSTGAARSQKDTGGQRDTDSPPQRSWLPERLVHLSTLDVTG